MEGRRVCSKKGCENPCMLEMVVHTEVGQAGLYVCMTHLLTASMFLEELATGLIDSGAKT